MRLGSLEIQALKHMAEQLPVSPCRERQMEIHTQKPAHSHCILASLASTHASLSCCMLVLCSLIVAESSIYISSSFLFFLRFCWHWMIWCALYAWRMSGLDQVACLPCLLWANTISPLFHIISLADWDEPLNPWNSTLCLLCSIDYTAGLISTLDFMKPCLAYTISHTWTQKRTHIHIHTEMKTVSLKWCSGDFLVVSVLFVSIW